MLDLTDLNTRPSRTAGTQARGAAGRSVELDARSDSASPIILNDGATRSRSSQAQTQQQPSQMPALGASWRHAMIQALGTRGINVDELLTRLNVSPDEQDPRVLSDGYNQLWSLAVTQTGDPAIGLTVPAHPLVALGMLAHLVLAARTLGDAMRYLLRFSPLLSPTLHLEMQSTGATQCLTLSILGGMQPSPLQRVDFVANVLLHALRWITARDVRPVRIEYPFAQPADPAPWQKAMGCEVRFDADEFRMVFNKADFDIEIPTANADVAELCERNASQVMQQRGANVQMRVRQLLLQELAKGDPRRDMIASQLCMSERTLQRRLLEENTSFVKLVDETRRELAQRFLAKGDISPTEMSFALGFADPSNFYRACKRWFGHSPAQLRCAS
ncbi:MAG: AraC family transcriptional regulator [Burkholderiaceae bacterium]|nr:AraC family transcriptional regulator [Burkholderiaceae bacterium]